MPHDHESTGPETTGSASTESSPEETGITPVSTHLPDASEGFRVAERAAALAIDKKADDVVIVDLRGLSDVCDFFVIATGQADVQVRAIAGAVEDGLRKIGQRPVGVEGTNEGRWVLIDFFDVVVHVFRYEARDYYQLERLWADAPVLVVDADHLSSDGFRERQPELITPPAAGRAGEATEAP